MAEEQEHLKAFISHLSRGGEFTIEIDGIGYSIVNQIKDPKNPKVAFGKSCYEECSVQIRDCSKCDRQSVIISPYELSNQMIDGVRFEELWNRGYVNIIDCW